MSIEGNKSLVRRYYEEVVSTGDVERVSEFIAIGYTEVYRNVRHELGVEGARQHLLGVRRTYPDLVITVDHQIAEAEWVVSLVTARGTHSEEWLGIPASAATLEFTCVNVDRVVDGRIVEHGGAANLLEPMLEAGIIQPTGKRDSLET
jgi:predicted ester cyclase